jgi:hypothetical protein
MLSRVSERKMLSARVLLLLAWLILIASLFWDPYSIMLTQMGNTASPFRVTDTVIRVQDHQLVASPYPMGARIFWTMLVPILPLFLMVFGHEAWRRICPLSFASQIPGYMGLRRFRSRLERRTGLVSRSVALFDRQSWIARNSWYVQFGLLFAGIVSRLLIINTDRQAMGIALLAVIGAAMLTGFFWGGKTWCNYFCPANVVQKIYTEPGGIFESAPHFSRAALPQSMCRKPSPKGDVSACVACTSSCGDIDLQRSYWNGVLEPQRRNVYYMFFGLILGFYGYYYLYSGGWDYYFSGIWTHEEGVRQKLFGPGFFILGQVIQIPKIVAAPLTLAVACVASLAIGRVLEALYRRLRSREEDISEKVIIHHCLSVAAWLSINAFYLFGGRPNILLLPALDGRLVDVAIVSLTTVWLRRVLQQSPMLYQQESMASGLLEELKKLKVNVSKFLDGRKLEKLKANEIYLLTKVLPGFSQQQKLNAYRKILDEAVTNGTTANSSSLKLLEDFRHQMNITEEEHTQLLEELGLSDIANFDSSAVTAEEKTTSLYHYRGILSGMIASRLDTGMAIRDILEDPVFHSTVSMLRQSLQINEDEHHAAVEELSKQSGLVGTKMEEALGALVRQKSIRLCIQAADISDPLGIALLDLLLEALAPHERAIRRKALSILSNLPAEPEFQRHAEDLASLSDHELESILHEAAPSNPTKRWREVLNPKMLAILQGETTADLGGMAEVPAERWTDRKAILGSLDVESNLSALLRLEDPLVRAIGLTAFGYIEPPIARETAERMLTDDTTYDHPLLLAAVEHMAGVSEDPQARPMTLRAAIHVAGQPEQVVTSEKNHITMGRAPDNDIVITDPAAWAYHVAIRSRQGEVRLIRLDDGGVFVNGRQLQEESIVLSKGSIVNLRDLGQNSPKIVIDWDRESNTGSGLTIHPVLRLAMLRRNRSLSRLPLGRLADIALQAQVERYIRGTNLMNAFAQDQYFLIHQGQIRLFDPLKMDFLPKIAFGPGDLIGSDLIDASPPVFAEVVSGFATLMLLSPPRDMKVAAPRQLDSSALLSGCAMDSRKAFEHPSSE